MIYDYNCGMKHLYIDTGNGYQELETGEINASIGNYSECEDLSLSTTGTISFKMNKKQWYRLQKSLGFIKPIYKKKRKGKRYILYEVI